MTRILILLALVGCASAPQSPVDKCGTDQDYIFEDGKCSPVDNDTLHKDAFGDGDGL